MLEGKYGHGVTRVNNVIYCAGGSKSNSTQIYDIESNTWNKGPELICGEKVTLTTVDDRYIYAIGGKDFDT